MKEGEGREGPGRKSVDRTENGGVKQPGAQPQEQKMSFLDYVSQVFP